MPYGTPDVIIINGTPIVGGTPGEILFVGAGNVIDEDPSLFWDNTNKQLLLGDGSITNPSYSFVNSPTTGFYRAFADIIGIATSGSSRIIIQANESRYGSTVNRSWSSSASPLASASDLILTRDAANTLAQRNGTAAQAHHIYNTFTDASNYERALIAWQSNALQIRTNALGTGTVRNINIFAGTGASFGFGGNDSTQWAVGGGPLFPTADNTRDIGFTGTLRPRTIYVGTSIQIEANNGLRLTNQTDGAAANVGTLANAPSAGDPAFWLPVTINGNTRYIPCWA